MTAAEIIIQKINDKGPVSFHDFMELSLYHPTAGYYTSPLERIGPNGDYYTSPELSPVFGEMIGRQLEEMWDLLGKKEFTVVEYGAGTGQLCFDILEYLKNNEAFYNKLSYCIIEKSGTMREREKMLLPDKVKWYHSIRQIPDISGCILSNELVDNFSVHRVLMADELMEVFVDHNNGFAETLLPAGEQLKEYLLQHDIHLSKGFRTEINLLAEVWMKEVGAGLKEGFVMTIDYGHISSRLYDSRHREGTLMCYHKHYLNADPYQHIGEQDITAQVNFSALHRSGLQHGLTGCGLSTQGNFLRSLGIAKQIRKMEVQAGRNIAAYCDKASKLNTILLGLGNKMKVLIQQKGSKIQQLAGMRLSEQLA